MAHINSLDLGRPRAIRGDMSARETIPVAVPKYDLRLKHQPGFDFGMEPLFWQAFTDICRLESIDEQELVARAGRNYPESRVDSAVRLEVAHYYFLKCCNHDELDQAAEVPNADISPSLTVPVETPRRRRDRILLVDDDPDVLRVVKSILLAGGFAVTVARSADDALRCLEDCKDFALVMSDYAMVGMNGVELLDRVRQNLPGIPGLIISGYVTTATNEVAHTDFECVSKPFRKRDLLQKVNAMIESRAASAVPPNTDIGQSWDLDQSKIHTKGVPVV